MTEIEIAKPYLSKYRADLPRLIGMNRNLMWFPTSVLNTKSAFTHKNIMVKWETVDPITRKKNYHSFEFAPMRNNPLPLAEHSKLFDILLALYANNCIQQTDLDVGVLYFRMSDVANIAGKQYTDGFRHSLAEAIYRYMRCVAFWQNAYLINGTRGNLSCTPIEESSLWDNSAGRNDYNDRQRLKARSPGNSKNQSNWNLIKFNNRIAEVLHNCDTRLFLSEVIRSNLPPIPYIIYRYFYAFSDLDYVDRSLETLCQNFGFSGRRANFPDWFQKQLDIITRSNLLEDYCWPTNIKDWNEAKVRVKCKNFTTQNLVNKNSLSKFENVDKMSNMALLEYYIRFKQLNILTADLLSLLEQIEKTADKEYFYSMLKTVLTQHADKFNAVLIEKI